MPDFTNIDVQLGKLDTDTDPRALPIGALTTAENASTQQGGVYRKRNGFVALAKDIAGRGVTGTLAKIRRLAKRGNSLLCADDHYLYQRTSESKWMQIGRLPEAQLSRAPLERRQDGDVYPAQVGYASNGSFKLVAWTVLVDPGTSYSIEAKIIDASGSVMWTFATTPSANIVGQVHCVACGQYLILVYGDQTAGNVHVVSFDSATQAWSLDTVIRNDYAGTTLTACEAKAGFFCLAYRSTGPAVMFATVSSALGVLSTMSYAETVTALASLYSGTTLKVIWSSGTNTIRGCALNVANDGTLTGEGASHVVSAITTPNVLALALAPVDSSHFRAYWTRQTTPYPTTYMAAIDNSFNVGTITPQQDACIASHPWVYDSRYYMVVSAGMCGVSSVASLVVADVTSDPWRPVGLAARQSSQSVSMDGWQVVQSGSKVEIPAVVHYKLISQSAPRRALDMLTIDMLPATPWAPVEALGTTVLAGANPVRFDGQEITDLQYVQAPTVVTPVAYASGGFMADGDYYYSCVFENTDRAGNTNRSAVCAPVKVTVVGGGGAGRVELAIDAPTFATRTQGHAVGIYRSTKDDAATLHRVAQLPATFSAMTLYYTDTQADAAISSNERMYTTGGVLEREPVPACDRFIQHQGRLWGVSSEDRKTVFCSGSLVAGEAPWFNAVQSFRIEDGDVTALASMDDKLIVFTDSAVYRVFGSGMNQTGAGSTLTLPTVITGDVGCSDWRSVVTAPQGVLFLSKKGLYCLTRSESLIYLGRPVQGLLNTYQTITSAEMVTDQQEVRFTVTDGQDGGKGRVVVYNYDADAWTHWSVCGEALAVSAISCGGVWHFATSGASVYSESPGSYTDDGAFVAMTIETAWIAPFGQQGFGRINRALMLGHQMGRHALTISAAKDYAGTYTMSKSWTWTELDALSDEQVALQLSSPKGQSFRFKVADAADGTASEGYQMNGLLLQAKPIRGNFEKALVAGAKG